MKRKTWFRIFTLVLVLILALTSLSGCKKKNVEPNGQNNQEQVQEEVQESSSDNQNNQEDNPEGKESTSDESNGVTTESEPAGNEVTESELSVDEDGYYYSKDEVALYLHTYGHLPDNFMTKKEAKKLGWSGGSLEKYAPGMVIGGDNFGNYEGNLPEDKTYHECDIDTLGQKKRGAKRIVFSDDGYIYYTEDHYETFELLYEGD